MNVLTIISRDLQKASTHFRVVQYLDFFKSRGVDFQFVHRKSLSGMDISSVRAADLLFNQKCLFNYSLAKKMINESRRTLFDFDDAIFTRPGKRDFFLTRLRVRRRLHLWLRRADVVTTPNQYLADYARRLSGSVEIIPMAVDLRLWHPVKKDVKSKTGLVIGWAGSPVNIPLFESLDLVLAEVKRKHPETGIAVFSGKKPRMSFPVEYHPFEPGKEADFIQKLDIGLLPLQNDNFSMGKSPIKAIQYLACGVPVVGNILGATAEILNEKNALAVNTPEEWIEGLTRLMGTPELIARMGAAGREHIERNHDILKVREKFLDILCKT